MGKTIWIVVSFVFLAGCVTPRGLEREKRDAYQVGYDAADKECIELQKKINVVIQNIQRDRIEKTERLRAFNQVDGEGNLRQ